MEDNLNSVGGLIGNLKSMAVDMGTEIDKQNKQIDRITDKVTRVPKSDQISNIQSLDLFKKYIFIFFSIFMHPVKAALFACI